MKRIRKTTTSPPKLADYIRDNPVSSECHTWDSFRNNCPSGLREVQETLSKDQGTLCAYCELELVPRYDFRISHFHPKRGNGEELDRSWELRWDNMHGACNGGTTYCFSKPIRYVVSNNEEDKHCDVVTGNEILDNIVLNPLNIPAFPRLFKYKEEDLPAGDKGLRIEPEDDAPPEAQHTIDAFHLNSTNLKKMRYATYEALKSKLAEYINQGDEIAAAMKRMAGVVFAEKEKWPEFFTVWRWALRDEAEQMLKAMNYDG